IAMLFLIINNHSSRRTHFPYTTLFRSNKAGLSADQRDAIVDLLEKFKLPIKLPKNFPRQKIVEALKFDKKFEGGKVRFVVTPRIGAAHLTNNVTLEDIPYAVSQL